eukprot:7186429-Prymnesium_polylepis.2
MRCAHRRVRRGPARRSRGACGSRATAVEHPRRSHTSAARCFSGTASASARGSCGSTSAPHGAPTALARCSPRPSRATWPRARGRAGGTRSTQR